MTSENTQQSILIISQQSPYANAKAQEALDVVLTAAAYEIPVNLLLCGDGVFQLLPNQDGSSIGKKNLASNLQALEIYGVDTIYICEKSLTMRGLEATPFAIEITPINHASITALIADHQHVLTV